METVKPLQIDAATHTNLKRLAADHKRPMKQFVAEMVNYFKQTGQDPQEVKSGSSANAIKSLEKRITTFMRNHEKEALTPMLDELAVASRGMKKYAADTVSKELFAEKMTAIGNALKQVSQQQNEEITRMKMTHDNQVKNLLAELRQIKEVIEDKMGKKGMFS